MSDVAFSAQELMKWSGAIFIAAIQGYVLYNLAFKKKTWDLSGLLLAEDGVASMARFQLMLFTFAIVGGYFFILLRTEQFPKLDPTTLGLLGISGGTYAISKGIQASRDTDLKASSGTGGTGSGASGGGSTGGTTGGSTTGGSGTGGSGASGSGASGTTGSGSGSSGTGGSGSGASGSGASGTTGSGSGSS